MTFIQAKHFQFALKNSRNRAAGRTLRPSHSPTRPPGFAPRRSSSPPSFSLVRASTLTFLQTLLHRLQLSPCNSTPSLSPPALSTPRRIHGSRDHFHSSHRC